MIRKSTHSLKFANKNKIELLDTLFINYQIQLKFYVNLIIKEELPIQSFLSSNYLPNYVINHSRWKQLIYKNAVEIIKSNWKKKQNERYNKYKKIYKYFKNVGRQEKFLDKRWKELSLNPILKYMKFNLNSYSIIIDERFLSYNFNSSYDEFVGIKLPFFHKNKKRAIQINLPIKYHNHSLKFKTWNRRKSIQIFKRNGIFYLNFFYEKEFNQNKNTDLLALDCGYNKLLSDSNGIHYGIELKKLYERISNKQQGSKKFKKILIFRNNSINKIINEINLSNIEILFIEDLKNVKHKSKYHKKINNKLQRWVYSKVLNKLNQRCEIEGIKLIKVNPAYTSQICSHCGFKHEENRNLESFKCLNCGVELDADTNAAKNILHRGVYSLSTN